MEIKIKLYWSNDMMKKEDNKFLRLVFEGIEKCLITELFVWDYIMDVYLSYITLNNKEFICFSDGERDSNFHVVCEKIKYEEME